MWLTGTYREIGPVEWLVKTESPADAEGNVVDMTHYGMPLETLVTLKLEEEGKSRTRMTLWHAGLPEGDYRKGRERGTSRHSRSLQQCWRRRGKGAILAKTASASYHTLCACVRLPVTTISTQVELLGPLALRQLSCQFGKNWPTTGELLRKPPWAASRSHGADIYAQVNPPLPSRMPLPVYDEKSGFRGGKGCPFEAASCKEGRCQSKARPVG